MNTLDIVYSFKNLPIKTIIADDKLWWSFINLCDVLKIQSHRNAYADIGDEYFKALEITYIDTDGAGTLSEMSTIEEKEIKVSKSKSKENSNTLSSNVTIDKEISTDIEDDSNPSQPVYYYSANDIGYETHTSCTVVGRIANANGIKSNKELCNKIASDKYSTPVYRHSKKGYSILLKLIEKYKKKEKIYAM